MTHIRQLDSLRAIAVVLVIISHWIPKLNILPWGEVGVDIFFVLSGFLISSILLENKKQVEVFNVTRSTVIKNFIIRRTLRIFPIYYLMVFVHYILADSTGTSVDENLVYYLTYTSNILFFRMGHFDGIVSHFWSLAVEEQFYLFWPWVILLTPGKKVLSVIWIFILIGIVFQWVIPGDAAILTPACFSAFGLGALLAYVRSRNVTLSSSQTRFLHLVALASFILLALYPLMKSTFFEYVYIRLPISIVSIWLIWYSLYGKGFAALDWVLERRTLQFLGKISYGIYIYHTMIPWLWRACFDSLREIGFDYHVLYFFVPTNLYNDIDLLLKFFLLIGLSWFSWVWIESPINALKSKFAYSGKGE